MFEYDHVFQSWGRHHDKDELMKTVLIKILDMVLNDRFPVSDEVRSHEKYGTILESIITTFLQKRYFFFIFVY